MNIVFALIIALVSTFSDDLDNCDGVQALVDSVNEQVAASGGHGDGFLFVYEDCSIDYQD